MHNKFTNHLNDSHYHCLFHEDLWGTNSAAKCAPVEHRWTSIHTEPKCSDSVYLLHEYCCHLKTTKLMTASKLTKFEPKGLCGNTRMGLISEVIPRRFNIVSQILWYSTGSSNREWKTLSTQSDGDNWISWFSAQSVIKKRYLNTSSITWSKNSSGSLCPSSMNEFSLRISSRVLAKSVFSAPHKYDDIDLGTKLCAPHVEIASDFLLFDIFKQILQLMNVKKDRDPHPKQLFWSPNLPFCLNYACLGTIEMVLVHCLLHWNCVWYKAKNGRIWVGNDNSWRVPRIAATCNQKEMRTGYYFQIWQVHHHCTCSQISLIIQHFLFYLGDPFY